MRRRPEVSLEHRVMTIMVVMITLGHLLTFSDRWFKELPPWVQIPIADTGHALVSGHSIAPILILLWLGRPLFGLSESTAERFLGRLFRIPRSENLPIKVESPSTPPPAPVVKPKAPKKSAPRRARKLPVATTEFPVAELAAAIVQELEKAKAEASQPFRSSQAQAKPPTKASPEAAPKRGAKKTTPPDSKDSSPPPNKARKPASPKGRPKKS